MLRFSILFLVLLFVLFTVEVLGPVETHVIYPFTEGLATFSTWLIGFFDDSVSTSGNAIHSTRVAWGVTIERGCNGVEAVIILFAAIFAFPAPWKHRLLGFLAGFVAIQALNLVRIISLFYLGEWETAKCIPGEECHRVWFEWFHLYLWQALIILDALVVWLVWLRYLPRPPRRGPPPAAPLTPAAA
ncbi:MAG: exosortase H [Xanthomonadales bacterium]|nr:exosortase H [Xanthomonadales bacterium]MCC6562376.1 exosortase H [Xanthomonadales bacterium]